MKWSNDQSRVELEPELRRTETRLDTQQWNRRDANDQQPLIIYTKKLLFS